MRLKTVFYLTTTLTLLIVLTTGSALDVVTTKMHHLLGVTRRAGDTASMGNHLQVRLRESNRLNDLLILTGEKRYLLQRDQARSEILRLYSALKSIERSPSDQKIIADSEQTARSLFSAQDRELSRTAGAADTPGILSALEAGLEIYNKNKSAELESILAEGNRYERLAYWIARIAILIAALSSVALLGLLQLAVFRPISVLVDTIILLRNGARGARVSTQRIHSAEIREASECLNELAQWLEDLEARKLQHMIGTVHDIRNPLTALKAIVAVLRGRPAQTVPRDEPTLLRALDEQLDRLKSMVDDYVDAQQIQSGHLPLEIADVDLGALATSVARIWRSTSKGHSIVCYVPPDPTIVRCDRNRIRQAVNNLVSNAVKYSPDGGTISIRVERDAESAKISVRDEGLGIAPEDQARIFEPFQRASAWQDVIPGTGLGLSSMKKIVEAHGGTVSVDSQPNQGSTFEIRIPDKQKLARSA